MRYPNLDLIGAWGPQYGYPGPALTAFGADDGSGQPGPVPAAAMAPISIPGFPWGGPFAPPAAAFSPVFEPSRAPAVALGAGYGPLALRKPLGFECDLLPACSRRVFKANPQEWYKIEGLFINRAVAPSVVVRSLTVGIQNMLSSCGGSLPGDMFTPDAENTFLNGFTAFPNQEICLEVENITENDVTFSAGLIGSVLSGGFPHLYGNAVAGGAV